MSIIQVHDHGDEPGCYVVKPKSAGFRYKGSLSDAGLVTMAGGTFAVAYWSYTARWYAYNTTTGQQITSFPKEFYETFIKPYRTLDFVSETTCPVSGGPIHQAA